MENSIKIKEFPNIVTVCDLIKRCGGKPNINVCGNGWIRIFILTKEGTTIGRLSFDQGVLKAVKCYKKDYCRDIDETDLIFMRLRKVLRTKEKIIYSEEEFWDLAEWAKTTAEEDLARKKQWREDNPTKMVLNKKTGKMKPKSRTRLEGRNPRAILDSKIQGW